MNFAETLKKFSEVEGMWKLDFMKNPKEKGYIIVENGIIRRAVLKKNNFYYKGNIAVEEFIKEADKYILVNYIPEEKKEMIFDLEEEKVTFNMDFVFSLLNKTEEAKRQVEKIHKIVETVKKIQGTKTKIKNNEKDDIIIPFGVPKTEVLAFIENGKVRINETRLSDEELEGIPRELTKSMIELGKGKGDIIVMGERGGYFFRYAPGKAIFLLLTKEGMGDLVLNLE